MRSTSFLTTIALAASGIVLSAGAASAQTTPNPDLKAFPTGPSCAEDVVTGTVRTAVVVKDLPKLSRPSVTVQLRWNAGGTAYPDTSVVSSRTYYLQGGTGDVAWSLDASAVPATAKNLLATAIAHPNAGSPASDTLQSKVLPASACDSAPATTTISRISLDCFGDVLDGEVSLDDPPSSGTLPATVAVQGRAAGATTWQPLGSEAASVTSTTTALPYQFSIAGKHMAEYRTRATVNNGAAVFSPVVSDARCAPAEVVPEAPSALLIPLTLTATTAPAPPTAPGTLLRPARVSERSRAVLLVLLAGAAVVAALPFSLLSLVQDYSHGAALGELALVPACALVLALVAAHRHPWVLHLRAGRADYAVAAAVFLPAVALLAWGPVVAGNHYYALRPDLLAVPLVAVAVVCLLFGVRGLIAFVVPLAVTTLVWPLPLRALMEPLAAAVAAATSAGVQALVAVVPLATVVPGRGDLRLSVDAPGGAFDVMVASACSGIAGIVGMLLVGLCAQYVLHGTRRARLSWLAAALVLAWVLNLVRIAVLLAVGTTLGEDIAMDVVHPVAGLLLLNGAMAVHVLLAGRFGLVFALRRPRPYDTPLTASVPQELRRGRGQTARRATALVSGVMVLAALGTVVPGTAAAYAGSLPAVRPFADNPSLGAGFVLSEGQEKTWSERYFGEGSSWMRYEAQPVRAEKGYAVWVDSVFTRDWSGLRAHPIVECYSFHDFELVRVARPTLTSGLLADEIVYRRADGATWHVLSWEWAVRTGDDIAHERVTLLASSLDGSLDPGMAGESEQGGFRGALARRLASGGLDPNPGLAAALRSNAAEIVEGHRIDVDAAA